MTEPDDAPLPTLLPDLGAPDQPGHRTTREGGLMDVTDEMVEAFCDAEAMDPARTRDGLAAVLALVERDYHVEPRHGDGTATRCGCPPGLCYGRNSRRPGQECGAVLDREAKP